MKTDILETIIRDIQEATGTDITSTKRDAEAVYLRAIYYKLALERTHFTYKVITRLVNRNHSTLVNSQANVFDDIKVFRPDLMDLYESLLHNYTPDEIRVLKGKVVQEELESLRAKIKMIHKAFDAEPFSILDLKDVIQATK